MNTEIESKLPKVTQVEPGFKTSISDFRLDSSITTAAWYHEGWLAPPVLQTGTNVLLLGSIAKNFYLMEVRRTHRELGKILLWWSL